ncbi:amidohydrolase family protein [Cupidesulfovibrio sp. SRB-5]|nr:amidohydrolase family protein [Nitratidesulfovibrio sp. SRB-5]MBZ2172420.1 amidohydrolase family protein [Nitratidesulfovibrio sp. SRB-5]
MLIAVRARRVIPLAGEGPSRDPRDLFSPPRVLDDHVVVIRGVFLDGTGQPALAEGAEAPYGADGADGAARVLSGVRGGVIEAVEPMDAFRRRTGVPLTDLGDVTLLPGVVNCHTHLELSHLAGRTVLGGGFVPWVKSLLPLAGAETPPDVRTAALADAARQLAACHTAHVGDITAVAPAAVRRAMQAASIGCSHFAEVFGYRFTAPDGESAAPPTHPADTAALWPRAMAELASDLAVDDVAPFGPAGASPATGAPFPVHPDAALAGHALYSTHPVALAAARRWCERNHRVFSMHLAEHPDEVEFLTTGRGALADLLAVRVLPPGFVAAGMRPVPYAAELGLLDEGTLAVHCVQLDAADIRLLAESGAHVCLCPRSNAAINVGSAPARALAEAGAPLCLGTDSLASNHDLDLWNEARALRDLPAGHDLPPAALLRLLTADGAAALGRGDIGAIVPGRRARLALLPQDFSQALGTTP